MNEERTKYLPNGRETLPTALRRYNAETWRGKMPRLEEAADEIEAAYALIRDVTGWSARSGPLDPRLFRSIGKKHVGVIGRAIGVSVCEHEWKPDLHPGGDAGTGPDFRWNSAISDRPVVRAQCKICDARTWLTEDQWASPNESLPKGENDA